MKPDRNIELLDRPPHAGRYMVIPTSYIIDEDGVRIVTVYRGAGTLLNALIYRDAEGVERIAAGPYGAARAKWIPMSKLQD